MTIPRQKKNLKGRGFTLVELIVVVSIFTAITSVLLVKFSLFNNTILTTNLAYDIALSIRQAQSYGINVRGFDRPGSGITFDTGYGIHFDDSSTNSYIFFADLNKNNRYAPNELIQTFNISGGHTLQSFCGTGGSGEKCSNLGEIDNIDIVFIRPDPDASINTYSPPVNFQKATITVVSPQGVTRSIEIYSTGQISIVNNP